MMRNKTNGPVTNREQTGNRLGLWTAASRAGRLAGVIAAACGLLMAGCSPKNESAEGGSTNVRSIAQADFETEVLRAELPVVVDFYADWCGPCRVLSPMLDRIAGQFTNEIKVVKINVDHAGDLAAKYEISAIPTLKFFRSGKEVGSLTGLPSEEDLKKRIQELAASPAA